MKADLPKREPALLEYWEGIKLYDKLLETHKQSAKFILHDGPPYANGPIHMGHALNKTLKDIILRYKSFCGFQTPYTPGWDCHGLPIEQALLKELKIGQKDARKDPVAFRKKCREFVLSMLEVQRDDFKRLGLIGDWAHPYITMELPYAAKIVEAFLKLYEKGYIYKGLKPVFWCINCETALAHAEIEYTDKSSPSIYVRFDVTEPANKKLSLVIWTTTPWTLPANRAVCVHPKATYRVLTQEKGDHDLVVLDNLAEKLAKLFSAKITDQTYKGEELGRWKVTSPLAPASKNPVPVIYDEGVELGEGTGIVHIAPGHGEEDFRLSKKFKNLNIEVASPVNSDGHFTEEVGNPNLAALRISEEKTKEKIFEELGTRLIHEDKIQHSYPHCWRCKKPVIFRATEQWFLNIEHENLRERILKAIEQTAWLPPTSKERIKSMVESRPDWCLSRQRIWGAPIPILYCKPCGYERNQDAGQGAQMNQAIVKYISEKGEDAWFDPTSDFLSALGKQFPCPKCQSQEIVADTNILDVWMDSGISWFSVLESNEEKPPADLYLEGSDQHRGWFQTSIITSCALNNQAPYKAVYTNGWVLDDQGRAMHKSLGNVVSPQNVVRSWGADILRLWASSAESLEDVRVSDRLMTAHAENYKKIRNSIRYMLGNLADFSPHEHGIGSYEKLEQTERWALLKLYDVITGTRAAYDQFGFSKVLHSIIEFSVHDLSNFFFDISKDRLYTFAPNDPDRRATQSVLYVIAHNYLRMLAPILPFTCEEAWQELAKSLKSKEPIVLCNVKLEFPQSIHLGTYPLACADWNNEALAADIKVLTEIRSLVNQNLDLARKNQGLGSSLAAKVEIASPEKIDKILQAWESRLPTIFLTSYVEVKKHPDNNKTDCVVTISKAEGKKCARCWIYHIGVGDDPRDPDLCAKCALFVLGKPEPTKII